MPLLFFHPYARLIFLFFWFYAESNSCKGRDRQNVAANFRHIAWNLAVAGFHFRKHIHRCEQSC